MAAVERIDIDVTVVVGTAALPLAELLALGRGAFVRLGRDAAQPLAVLANGRRIADGRVKLIGDRVGIEVA
jgi:flagellar motor switch protein FliN/FliY